MTDDDREITETEINHVNEYMTAYLISVNEAILAGLLDDHLAMITTMIIRRTRIRMALDDSVEHFLDGLTERLNRVDIHNSEEPEPPEPEATVQPGAVQRQS